MHGGSLIGARVPRGSIRHTLLKILQCSAVQCSAGQKQLDRDYTQGHSPIPCFHKGNGELFSCRLRRNFLSILCTDTLIQIQGGNYESGSATLLLKAYTKCNQVLIGFVADATKGDNVTKVFLLRPKVTHLGA